MLRDFAEHGDSRGVNVIAIKKGKSGESHVFFFDDELSSKRALNQSLCRFVLDRDLDFNFNDAHEVLATYRRMFNKDYDE